MSKFYITRYCLTDGFVSVVEGTALEGQFEGMLQVPSASGINGHIMYHGEGRDWHHTETSARERFEELKSKAIKSAEKKLAKLRAMTFKVVEKK